MPQMDSLARDLVSTASSRRARIKDLTQTLARLEARIARSAPIPVIHLRECNHPECGAAAPPQGLSDALVIVLGCRHAAPTPTEI